MPTANNIKFIDPRIRLSEGDLRKKTETTSSAAGARNCMIVENLLNNSFRLEK